MLRTRDGISTLKSVSKKMGFERKRSVKRGKLSYLLLAIAISMALFYILKEDLNVTGFAVLQTLTQSDFNTGTYNETIYNATSLAVQLNESAAQTYRFSGNYTSAILDAGAVSNLRNLSWTENISIPFVNVSFHVRSCLTSNCL